MNGRVYNLPPFREDAPFAQASSAGGWVAAPGSLRALGQSLAGADEAPGGGQSTVVRAVPDPWAQPKSFAEALLDEGHSLHRAVTAQWRGLLALFALADLRRADYTLDLEQVDLAGDLPFDRVLRHLAPKLAVGGQHELWLRPHILRIHPTRARAQAIGILNPGCLVAPGRAGWSVTIDAVPWIRDGIQDPLTLPPDRALSNGRLAVLRAYIANVREALPRNDDRVASGVRQALTAFADAVQELLGTSPAVARVRRVPDSGYPAIYRTLLLPAELEEPADPATMSECRVQLADVAGRGAAPPAAADGQTNPAAREAGVAGFILVDESIAATLNRPARNVTAWGNLSLGDLLESKFAFEAAQRQAAEAGWLMITADQLFSSRLVRLGRDPRIPGHVADMRDMLEPIRPLALLLDQANTRGCEVDRGERRAGATLHLKLKGQGSATIPHALHRVYRADALAGEPQLVTDVEWSIGQTSIWPDFRSSAWSLYLVRLSYPTVREQIRPKQALSREMIAAAITSAPTPQQAVQMALSINDGEPIPADLPFLQRVKVEAPKAYEEIQRSDQPVDAIFYVDYHPDRREAAAGCVRLKLEEPRARGNPAAVAIDFGSTNSVACLSSTGQPVTLKARVVHPIEFASASRNDEWKFNVRWNYVDFLPISDRKTPTPTVVIRRNDIPQEVDFWLYRDLIYFQPAGSHHAGGAAEEIRKLESYLKRSQFDLKWSEEPQQMVAAADYLEQFMTMVAAEAAAAEYDPGLIEWRFSVPDAMRGNRLITFRNQVEEAREKLSPRGRLDDLYSEGLAAARFILSGQQGSKFTQGSINAILDIGGSTTDITLWANDKLVWKGSFRLAGRAFFTETIVQNPEILRAVELGDWADLIDPGKADRVPKDKVADVGELLFSRPALEEAFDKHWNRQLSVKPGEVLRSTALVYLSGIAYYLGRVARGLVRDGVLHERDLARPAFALCGRGAGIFRRLHGSGSPDMESPATQCLQTFSTASGAQDVARPQLFISRQPKLEVAAGMMVDFPAIDARSGKGVPLSTFTPAGLQVSFADQSTVDPDEPIEGVRRSNASRGSDLGTLLEFLKQLEQSAGIGIDLKKQAGQGAFNEIATVVRQRVDRQRGEDGATALGEPPFITALAALVAIMASPSDERNVRMTLTTEDR